MYKAVRAFYRFSKYPETRPLRWRAFRVQAARDMARVALFVVTCPIWLPIVAFMAVTLPIAWLHDYFDRESPLQIFSAPLRPIEAWWLRTVEEVNPIYLAAEKRAEDIIR